MFCPGCGHKLKGGESFCTNCGRSLKKKQTKRRRSLEDVDSYRSYTAYRTIIRTSEGKKKIIYEEDSRNYMYG